MIPFGDYLPDLPAMGGHATVASNVTPEIGYYGPFYSAASYGAASTEEALGAFSAFTSTGTAYNFVGTDSYLQRDNAGVWEDVSVAGGYNTGTGRWDFCQFGQRVIATNGVEKPQSYVMGTSSDFAVLTTDDLIAKTCAVVRGFVFFGNTTESAVNYPNRVRWSALEDPTDYTASVTTQSDYQDLFGETDVGNVIKIIGGDVATIFCERGIFRATYVGGDVIFQFDQIINNNGTRAAGSVVAFAETIFFHGSDGFYALSPGGLNPIGRGKVDNTFQNEVYADEINSISAAIDPNNSLYVVAYPTSSGALHKLMVFNYVANRWATAAPTNLECLFQFASTSGYADPRSTLAGFNTSHTIVIFNGAALTATVETAENKFNPGMTMIRNLTPHIEGTSSDITGYVGYRNTPQESVSYSLGSTMNSNGECNLFNHSRYQRVKVTIGSGFTKAYGVDIDGLAVGKY